MITLNKAKAQSIVVVRVNGMWKEYCEWLEYTGISCKWDFHWHLGKEYMIIEFVENEDVVAFKLKFKNDTQIRYY
jgi:hypothetical protein